MSGLVDYVLWRGDVSFNASPFNKIDALILSQLVYLNFKGVIPETFDESVEMNQFSEDRIDKRTEKKLSKKLGPYINPEILTLLKICAVSNRFGSLKLTAFRDIYSKKNCEQFAAFTVCGKDFNCVCYRGTDETIIGWKEDFELGYMDCIPSQNDALEYLSEGMKKLSGKFILSGHSKGGNNAMYAAFKSDAAYKKRIVSIFNFDGPGFVREILDSTDFKKISGKIHSVYPECSIVGMFFEHPDDFEIVESSRHIVMQHDPFSWEILGTSFVNKNEFEDESIFFYKTFNQWYSGLSKEQMKSVTDRMFGVILNTGVETLSDMEKDPLLNSGKILNELLKINSKDRRDILQLVHMFVKSGKGNFPLFENFKLSLKS